MQKNKRKLEEKESVKSEEKKQKTGNCSCELTDPDEMNANTFMSITNKVENTISVDDIIKLFDGNIVYPCDASLRKLESVIIENEDKCMPSVRAFFSRYLDLSKKDGRDKGMLACIAEKCLALKPSYRFITDGISTFDEITEKRLIVPNLSPTWGIVYRRIVLDTTNTRSREKREKAFRDALEDSETFSNLPSNQYDYFEDLQWQNLYHEMIEAAQKKFDYVITRYDKHTYWMGELDTEMSKHAHKLLNDMLLVYSKGVHDDLVVTDSWCRAEPLWDSLVELRYPVSSFITKSFTWSWFNGHSDRVTAYRKKFNNRWGPIERVIDTRLPTELKRCIFSFIEGGIYYISTPPTPSSSSV